jgi:threonine dehydrogenase-like Zn-dependent dehydrogenase
MKALVKEKPERGIALREIPLPELRPGWVLVKMRACGISGSEINRFRWTNAYDAGRPKDMTRQLPRIMGHEFSGYIAALGPGVVGLSEGDAVVVQSVIGCGACEHCDAGYPNHCNRRITLGVHADGGFAEYCAVPAPNVYPVPEGVAMEDVALLQPFAIAAYALEVAQMRPADRIGVWGVGAIGASIIQQAGLGGGIVEFAVGRDKDRLDAVRKLGARQAFSALDGDPAPRLAEQFARRKLDIIFEVSGHTPAINASLGLLKKRGRVVLIGNLKEPFEGDLLQAIMDQISILTVRTYSLSAWRRALALLPLARGERDVLPVEYVPIEDGVAAFERAAANAGKKFVLTA